MLGAVDAPETMSICLGMVTALATASVTPLESAPTMATTFSTSTRARAASTPCTGFTAVSRLTISIGAPSTPPARLTWLEASSTALRSGGPNSESEPVKVLRFPTISGSCPSSSRQDTLAATASANTAASARTARPESRFANMLSSHVYDSPRLRSSADSIQYRERAMRAAQSMQKSGVPAPAGRLCERGGRRGVHDAAMISSIEGSGIPACHVGSRSSSRFPLGS